MTTEDRVRKAVEVANELVQRNALHPNDYEGQWGRVFDAMVYSTNPDTGETTIAGDTSQPVLD